MSRNKIYLITSLAGVIVILFAISQVNTTIHKSLTFFTFETNPNKGITMPVLESQLKPGDTVFYITTDPSSVNKLKAKFTSGVNIYSFGGFNSINDWRTKASTLSAGYDYLMYDYEPGVGFSPEFTTDQTTSNSYFSEIFNDVHAYNTRTNGHAKFIISFGFVPVRGDTWDFGQVQARSDALDVQLFGSQQVLNTILSHISHISSTNSNFIVQLGLNADKNQTAEQAIAVINATQNNTSIQSYSFVVIKNITPSSLQEVIQYWHSLFSRTG